MIPDDIITVLFSIVQLKRRFPEADCDKERVSHDRNKRTDKNISAEKRRAGNSA